MPYDLDRVLVVGISSRALFDLEYENEIFEKKGLIAFLDYERRHEEDVLNRGTGFRIVQDLLRLNPANGQRRVEVILMSRNHPDVHLRVSNSIRHHKLDITRAMLTGGEPLRPYLTGYKIDLFLSASDEDVRAAIASGVAAGRIYMPPVELPPPSPQIRIAFDGDCVLFNEEAEMVNQRDGLTAFHKHELEKALIPLPDGPFANLIRTISQMQGDVPEESPFRIGLVTARNYPAHERAIRTLRAWHVRLDNGAFLGGLPKDPWLKAFQPQIFFDDQEAHCRTASKVVPTAQVPFPFEETEAARPTVIVSRDTNPQRKNQFLLVCRGYFKGTGGYPTKVLDQWYSNYLADCDEQTFSGFADELSKSIESTPVGDERPGKDAKNSDAAKFLAFLDGLLRKHSSANARPVNVQVK